MYLSALHKLCLLSSKVQTSLGSNLAELIGIERALFPTHSVFLLCRDILCEICSDHFSTEGKKNYSWRKNGLWQKNRQLQVTFLDVGFLVVSHDSIRGYVGLSVGRLVSRSVRYAFVLVGRDEPANDLFRVYELVFSTLLVWWISAKF